MKIIKPFLTNKGFLSGNQITLIENDEVITEEKILAEKYKNHYTNIVERSFGVRPTKLNLVNNSLNENESVTDPITCHFRNHPNVTEIKSKFMFAQSNAESSPSYLNPSYVAFLPKSLDIKKAPRLNKIPPKLVKTASDIFSVPLSQAINNMNGIFPDASKVAMVSPIDKKADHKNKIFNDRSVSVPEIFSKVYEIVLKNALVSALNDYRSPFISTYTEGYSTQHVLVRSIEE